MNTILFNCAASCVERQTRGQAQYLLLRLTAEEKQAYAIWILNEESHALSGLGEERCLAEKLFLQAVEGELSPLHLHDWVCDCEKSELLSILE